MSDETQLLPCPFCGGAAHGISMRNCDEIKVKHVPGCYIEEHTNFMYFHWDGECGIVGDALTKWNTRVCLPNTPISGQPPIDSIDGKAPEPHKGNP